MSQDVGTAGMVTFAFPEGHPHHGKTIVQGGVKFTRGVVEIPAAEAGKYATILTRFHGAAIVGSSDMERLEAEYAAITAEKKKATAEKKAAAEKKDGGAGAGDGAKS